MKVLLGVTSLLFSTALLLVGHGMQLTLLPLRAESLGISSFLIGVSASAYFLGFVAGCLTVPRLVGRIGHIRAFSVMTGLLLTAILALDLVGYWQAWLLLRFMTGVGICGFYSVIESWLNSQADAASRGKVLSVYTFITLAAMTAGQFMINVGPVSSSVPFTVAALCMALAILPVSMTRRMQPEPVESPRVGFTLLYSRSRSAFAGALLSGLVVGSFWSLGAVFARRYMETQMDVTVFMSLAIAGGALAQYPVGWLSDRVDRRWVLLMLALCGALASLAVALSTAQPWFLAAVCLFGATVMPLYAMSLATAADVSEGREFVAIGTSVLLLNALGAVAAPLLLGPLMTQFNATALFWSFSAICALFVVYLAVQLRTPRTIALEAQVPFEVAVTETAPVAFEMDPRTKHELAEGQAPVAPMGPSGPGSDKQHTN